MELRSVGARVGSDAEGHAAELRGTVGKAGVQLRITSKTRTLKIGATTVGVRRNVSGVIELRADHAVGIAMGTGYVHAHDRLVQMALFRLVGQGRLSECLKSGESQLRLDVFARTMGFAHDAAQEVERCTSIALATAEAYARGVNHFLQQDRLPIELQLVGYRPEPWTVADTLTVLKVSSYVMANAQRELEKFLIESLQQGVSLVKLRQLFSPHLDGFSEESVENLRRVRIWEPRTSSSARSVLAKNPFVASNNWAIAAHRSATGYPLECHDPHLPCNHLPQPWYELVTSIGGCYGIGVSIPGVPGIVMGRNNDVSFGFTYGYMDMIDYFLEHVRGENCLRGDAWQLFRVRPETIRRRRAPSMELLVRETDCGMLECDPLQPTMAEGIHLCCAWSGKKVGAAEWLDAIVRVADARTVPAAQQILRRAPISANWVLADRSGNIGYQQSGLLPRRAHSGLYPLPAWEEQNTWNGFVDDDQLANALNPSCGFVVTANDPHQAQDAPLSINVCMGSDRAARITEMLAAKPLFTTADMLAMQQDVKSKQAERYLNVLRPLLPADSPSGRILRDWDLCYDRDSRGATVFECVYARLLAEVFATSLLGDKWWSYFVHETSLFANYFHYFDNWILKDGEWGDDRAWFGSDGREGLVRDVLRRVLKECDSSEILPWGVQRRVTFDNLFLGSRLSRFFGVSHGPIEIEGGRCTIAQSTATQGAGEPLTVAASYRNVTDLGQDSAQTSLAGGASGRPCSRWYRSELEKWFRGEYKRLQFDHAAEATSHEK